MRYLSLALILGAAVAGVATQGLAGLESVGTDSEQNRQLLVRWRQQQPERVTRLEQHMRLFLAIPVERQARIRHFDRELYDRHSVQRMRLCRTLERYALWRALLTPAERGQIDAIGNPRERLRRVKELREEQLINLLSREVREAYQKAPLGPVRAELRRRLLRQARDQQLDWLIASRNLTEVLTVRERNLPHQLVDLPVPAQHFLTDYLRPLLSRADAERLNEAEGRWPRFPRLVVEFSDRYPVEIPGWIPMKERQLRWHTLPKEIQQRLLKAEPRLQERLLATEGEHPWLDIALLVSEVSQSKTIPLPRQFGPCREEEFSPEVQQFIRSKLSAQDRDKLAAARGKWPEFPRILLHLAHQHGLKVPCRGSVISLPGPTGLWDKYRLVPFYQGNSKEVRPELTDKTLRDFISHDVPPEERGAMSVSSTDPAERERLRLLYFKHYPDEFERLRALDQQYLLNPAASPATNDVRK